MQLLALDLHLAVFQTTLFTYRARDTMHGREVVPTVAFVLLTCVAINACFYFVQINEHHRALQTASAGAPSPRRHAMRLFASNIHVEVLIGPMPQGFGRDVHCTSPCATPLPTVRVATAAKHQTHVDYTCRGCGYGSRRQTRCNNAQRQRGGMPEKCSLSTTHMPQEAALVEVTRSLLMLSDEPEARAWRAREEAYRARLLAVALDSAAAHHQFGMVRLTA